MEKENNKKRAAARRKYHDDVRALVDFCRRRDKRVIKHKLQLAKEKEARWAWMGVGCYCMDSRDLLTSHASTWSIATLAVERMRVCLGSCCIGLHCTALPCVA